MKLKLALIPAGLAVGFGGYMAFHPGVAVAEPAFSGEPVVLDNRHDYNIDTMHGGISFEITHLGLTKVHGRFNTYSGKIMLDPENVENSSVEFTAETNSIDTAIENRDNHLRNADFFDVEKYPKLTFKSTKVAKSGDSYVVTGDLTAKGKTKSISIPFELNGPYEMKHPRGNQTRIGIIAEPITIKRSDFGIGSTEPLPDGVMGVSDEVVVRIALGAILEEGE